MRRRTIGVLLATGLIGLLAVGCSSQSAGTTASADITAAAESISQQGEASEAAEPEVVTYKIGTEGAYPPFNLVNEQNEPDGYDVAVMKAIDELYPEIQFEYVATGWDGIFTALESAKIDAIVSQCGRNEEREAKYLFPDIPYTKSKVALVYKKGRTDLTDIESLAGKKLAMGTGNAQTIWLEKYNEEHPGQEVEILYTDGDISKTLQEIINGRADAHIASIKVTADYVIKEQGLEDELEVADFETYESQGTFVVLRQDESGEILKKYVDDGLRTLIENGTLKELSEEYLGGDYTPEL